MSPSTDSPRSRWVRPSTMYSIAALAAGLLVMGLRLAVGPWASILASAVALPLGFWVVERATIYPRVYRAKFLAMAGFLISFLGFSDAVGRLSYQSLWRKAFRLSGQEGVFENKTEGWRIRYPILWTNYLMKSEGVTTFFFKPEKMTPAVEFSLMHRPESAETDPESAARHFLLNLPKNGETQILSQGPVRYPLFQRAYEVVYEDPTQLIVLKHRLIFLSNAEGLTVLSVAASPAWFERLSGESNRFLFSFEPID